MGKAELISQEKLTSKLVQEMSKRGEVPDKYLLKDCFPQAIDAPDVWRNTLLIDLSLLTSSSAGAELAKLRSALSEWGCFQIINHGMESSFLEELIEVAKQFFALPLEEKHKCAGWSDDIFQGYGNDGAYNDISSGASWNDRLYLTLYPEDERNLHFWPHKPAKAREMLEEFTDKLTAMNEAIYKAMAKSLNLGDNCFSKHQGKQERIIGKFSLYPPCPCPEQVQGFRQHTDGTTMSIIVAEKDVEGLEIQKDDQWYKVPVIPGALFINIGDLGEVMSNGVFKSSMHRVVTNSAKDRVSVAAFCHPENVDVIEPVQEFVIAHQPQKFRSFSIDEYRRTFFKSYARGQSALDAFKLV